MIVEAKTQTLESAIKRANRYKLACRQAENLLEQKSRELFEVNKQLKHAKIEIEEDYKQALQELKESNTILQKTLHEKSNFLGQMSHEVRTPLNAIVGLSEILLRSTLEDEQSDYVKTILEGSNSLVLLLNNMLDITKIEAGRVEVYANEINPRIVAQNVIDLHFQNFEKKGLNIGLQVSKSVPELIVIDEGKYKQVIGNLISNAIKYTNKGGVVVALDYADCAITKGMGMFKTKVIDTGMGIPADDISQIFDAYQQIGRIGQGVGLGLTICKELSELMLGDIQCSSEVGKGSMFEVSLLAEKRIINKHSSTIGAESSSSYIKPMSILVAEDNPVNQKVFKAQLTILGQKADIANNGAEALEMLQRKKYDVVILDILMPVLDGEQAIKTLRASNVGMKSQYCIALTASIHKEEYFIDLGFDDYLSKPLLLTELAVALKKVPMADNDQDVALFPNTQSYVNVNTPSLFDDSYLRDQFGDAFNMIFVEIAPSFIEHAYLELMILEEHINNGRSEKAMKVSHSIKGAASSLGLNDLTSLLKAIEENPNSATVTDTFEKVKIIMDKLKPELVCALNDAKAALDVTQ